MKTIQLTMPDGSQWSLPVEVVEEHMRLCFEKDKSLYFKREPIEWLRNNMKWWDFKDHLKQIKPPDLIHYEDGWSEAMMEVVEDKP